MRVASSTRVIAAAVLALALAASATAAPPPAPIAPIWVAAALSSADFPEQRRQEIRAWIASGSAEACSATFDSVNRNDPDWQRRYLDACVNVRRYEELSAEQQSVAHHTVSFVSRDPLLGSARHCHGFLNRGMLITARHCFQDPRSTSIRVRLPPTLEARRLSGETVTLTFAQQSWSDGAAFRIDRDLIEAPVVGAESSLIAVAEPLHEGDQLLLIARHPYLAARDATGASTPLFMADDSPMCAVFMHFRTVMVHACQSERSISGAPIFRVGGDGKIEFAGVHTGFAGELFAAHRAQFEHNGNMTMLNYGITPVKP